MSYSIFFSSSSRLRLGVASGTSLTLLSRNDRVSDLIDLEDRHWISLFGSSIGIGCLGGSYDFFFIIFTKSFISPWFETCLE